MMTQIDREKTLLHHLGRVRALKIDVEAGASLGTATITVNVSGNELPALLQALGEHMLAPLVVMKAGSFVPVEQRPHQ